jgi:predicted ribosome quality control (RQC) complex YloA/Tae2 family protein
VGWHVQKLRVAHLGGREVALLQLRVPGETLHVVWAPGLGAGLLSDAARAAVKDAAAAWSKPGEARGRAVAEAALATLGEWVDGEVDATARGELVARGGRIAEAIARSEAGGKREALARALARATARVERRAAAVRGDLERAGGAEAMAARARLFVAEAARAPRGATRLVAVDWESGEAREVELKLDPARGAQDQVEAIFTRARRLKEGARIGRERLADAERTVGALAAVREALADAPDDALDGLVARARAAAPRDFKAASGAATAAGDAAQRGGAAGRRARAQRPLPPYRTFLAASGARILVGRGAERNDALTFHVARPHDLWLHAKSRAGAHVIVPLEKNASCPAEALVDAAHLAAHFSEARDEELVEIQHTPRRYLRKPRGSAPGFVVVDREKVLILRRDAEVLRRVLEREVEPTERDLP